MKVSMLEDPEFDDLLGGTSFAEMRDDVAAHLPGQHDQSSHNPHRGGAAVTPNFTVDGVVNPDAAREINAAMTRIQERMPWLTDGVKVRVGKGEREGVNGWVNRGDEHTVNLSERVVSDPSAHTRNRASLTADGYFSDTGGVSGIEATVTHEMGHIAHNRLGFRFTAGLEGDFEEMAEDSGFFSRDLSRYALTNHKEMIAESFSSYVLSDNPGEIASYIGASIEKEFAPLPSVKTLPETGITP